MIKRGYLVVLPLTLTLGLGSTSTTTTSAPSTAQGQDWCTGPPQAGQCLGPDCDDTCDPAALPCPQDQACEACHWRHELYNNFCQGMYDVPSWDTGDLKAVPVQFHIVHQKDWATTGVDCTPPPDLGDINAMLAELNTAFAGAMIEFQHFDPLNPLDEFEDEVLHRIECAVEYKALLSIPFGFPGGNNPYAIDVYFVDQLVAEACDCPTIPSEQPGICISSAGRATSTASDLQGVVIRNCGLEAHNPCSCGTPPVGGGGAPPVGECGDCDEAVIMGDCAIDTLKVFVHEMGHYFDLLHTHETAYGVECPGINQANCSTCGDFLCGTEAEPAPGEYEVADCVATLNYPLEFPPGCNAPYQPPDVTNYMNSKAEGALCRNHFTRGQLARARSALLNLRAEELLW